MPPTEDMGAPHEDVIPHSNIQRLVNELATMLANGIINNANNVPLDPIDPDSNTPMPYLPNLRDLLIRATGSDDLASVTEVKLKVITRDVGLQHLSVHTPNLSELTLDGSLISSLRDLGCRLNSLKVLKVNRCKLRCLDGLNGLRNIEKLYATHNKLTDLTPCTSLSLLRHLDVAGNLIEDMNVISFLALCTNLKDLVLEENFGLSNRENYRVDVKRLIPHLNTLDSVEFSASELPAPKTSSSTDMNKLSEVCDSNISSASSTSGMSNNSCYTVSFNPKVLSPRSDNTNAATVSDVQVTSNLHPKI